MVSFVILILGFFGDYMRVNKLAVICAILSCMIGVMFAVDTEDRGKLDQYQEELEERDWDALRQYLRSRREDEKAESKSALLISGDVRADWRNKHEVFRKENLLGGTAVDPFGVRRGSNKFDIEANLRLDYDLDKSWAVIQWQYDNKAGIDDETNCVESNFLGDRTCYCREMFGSGSCGGLCLKQAFFGYNLYKCGETEFDIEIGRRNLYHVFDSKVQFLSRFDGVLLSYGGSEKKVMDYYFRLAAFVVDYKVSHFAWVTEIGVLNIYDSGFDFKYSFIDWRKNGVNRCSSRIENCQKEIDCKDDCGGKCKHHCGHKVKCGIHTPPGTDFMISQWTAAYEIRKDTTCIKQPMRIFGAFLYNHNDPDPKCFVSAQNKAWYIGYRIGEVRKENDWAFQAMYQWVEALSIPDLDMSGIGNGNTLDGLILTDGFGNTNFKGWRFDGLYAFTDEISINARCEWSTQISRKLYNGGLHYYRQIKVELIYAF